MQTTYLASIWTNIKGFLVFLRALVSVLLLASLAVNSHAQNIDYYQLSAQEKADLARYLGWVWGDGRPGYDGTGIIYKGGNSNYKAVVTRLAQINVDGTKNPFGFPQSGNRKLTQVWDYWENSLPGGNPGDPQILREAIKHPNFLAGIIEGEGQIFHSDPNKDYYIADQSYAPSHPDKIYDIANFGPERMIQLFDLLKETYGFRNPSMSIKNIKYDYDSQRCEVAQKLRTEYQKRKEQNENGNLQSGFTVKIFIKPPNFDEIRNYGYFEKDSLKYRTPAPDNLLRVITTSYPDQNTEASGGTTFFDTDGIAGIQLLHQSGRYLNSYLDMVSSGNDEELGWRLIDLNNGYHRIESQNNAVSKRWLQAADNAEIKMVGERNTGQFTQWEKIPVANKPGHYYLKNRFHGSYLRVGIFDSVVKHGDPGTAAHWILEESESAACAQ